MINKVFKPLKKLDKLNCAYLYEDGQVLCIFERTVKDIGKRTEYAKLATKRSVRPNFRGRIVFHQPALLLAISLMKDAAITINVPSVERGSDNSKKRGLAVNDLIVNSADGYFSIVMIPDVLSSGITYQPEAQFKLINDKYGDAPVVEVDGVKL